MVHAIVPNGSRKLVVAEIFLEQADGLLVAHTDNDFALLSVLARRAVVAHKVNVILGIGQAHASRLRLIPRHCTQRKRGFCLSEAFHQTDARKLVELLIYGRVQRLACGGAIAQRREVKLGEVLVNHEAVYRGRCAEGGYAIL